jgi:hypothetical protein
MNKQRISDIVFILVSISLLVMTAYSIYAVYMNVKHQATTETLTYVLYSALGVAGLGSILLFILS